jgi:hypothetical protein
MEILAQLAGLAVMERAPNLVDRYRAESHNLLKAFDDTERAIAALRPAKLVDLASCESAIHAIELLLKAADHPLPRQDVIARVIDGGLWGGKAGTGLRVRKSLTMHLKDEPSSRMYGRIKEIRGLVGLFEWSDDRF